MFISVILPTHAPDQNRLRRTLGALLSQSLPPANHEIILVDNASVPPVDAVTTVSEVPTNLRLVVEPALGLTHARRRGVREARGEVIVFVDDDNVLAPDYLERVLELFASHPRLGALGGRSMPEFEAPPPPWVREFDDLIACRDLGPAPLTSGPHRRAPDGHYEYPSCAPIGAGMALRKEAAIAWLALPPNAITDRRGGELTSSGDNDIILTILESGWEVGYFPALSLTHLIPRGRTTRDYLARLNRGIAKSWVGVLLRHDASPWEPIPPWTLPLRKLKAWFTYRAWSGPAAYVRWQGACGHFEGRAARI